jgi:peptide chain release factor subunit 1
VCFGLFLQTGIELELIESIALLEWLANSYKGYGAILEIITDKSQEGAQFVRGFGGIGGMAEDCKFAKESI